MPISRLDLCLVFCPIFRPISSASLEASTIRERPINVGGRRVEGLEGCCTMPSSGLRSKPLIEERLLRITTGVKSEERTTSRSTSQDRSETVILAASQLLPLVGFVLPSDA